MFWTAGALDGDEVVADRIVDPLQGLPGQFDDPFGVGRDDLRSGVRTALGAALRLVSGLDDAQDQHTDEQDEQRRDQRDDRVEGVFRLLLPEVARYTQAIVPMEFARGMARNTLGDWKIAVPDSVR